MFKNAIPTIANYCVEISISTTEKLFFTHKVYTYTLFVKSNKREQAL